MIVSRMLFFLFAGVVLSLERGYFGNLRNPYISKGISQSFSLQEEHYKELKGLVPKGGVSVNLQLERLMKIVNSKTTDIEKYEFLQSLQDTSEYLYFSLLIKHTEKLMPYVYTPTVGEACLKWSENFREIPRGLYISLDDIGNVEDCFDNWPNKNVRVIVITDGERILGLGDLGSNGMPIPIGKLALYTACAGIPPEMCLPIQVDVGCNNEDIINDPYYIGLRNKRLPPNGIFYTTLIDDIILAAQKKYGRNVLIQFEDYGNVNAFSLLRRWENEATCFNDDIQGTASVALGGLLASQRMKHAENLGDHTYLFLGAGEAGCGIADLIAEYTGTSENIWLFDSRGLVESSRNKYLLEHKKRYSRDAPSFTNLEEAIQYIKPTVLIGVSGQPKAFNKTIVKSFVKFAYTQVPIIMALSNPTSKAECTAEEAYKWSENKAVFISGSPFNPVNCSDGVIRKPGQGNNAYVFPGIGLGAVLSGADKIDNGDMMLASRILAGMVSEETLQTGSCYPSLSDIRNVSANIAVGICKKKWNRKDSYLNDEYLYEWVKNFMYG